MDSRETKEQIAARSLAALEEHRQRFKYLEEAEAERLRQRLSFDEHRWLTSAVSRPMSRKRQSFDEHKRRKSAEEAQTLQPTSGKKKWSIGSIWYFFSLIINKLLRSFSCCRRGPSITSSGRAHVFSYKELEKATDCFNRRIGEGGFSSVYRGKLRDDRMVAVKVLFEGPKYVDEFTNEVNVLTDLRHPNLVSLYGCTDPGSQKLLLVYEFVPNGTIYDHLHGKLSPLSWTARIQIAIETVKALTYLHSLEPPVIHRDVKTSNILLDNELHVKVADFGMCRLLPLDKTCVTTKPRGTLGYRDPDYDKSFKLTAKSDVYSFGVVLLELISGEQAVDVNRQESDIYLFRMALTKIRNKELEYLIDRKVGYHYDCENYDRETRRMIDSVAELACTCLQPEANMRPSMKEVLSYLTAIRDWTEPIECETSKTE